MTFRNIYTYFCKLAGKSKFLKNIQSPPDGLARNLKLSGLKVEPEEVCAFAFLGVLIGVSIIGIVFVAAFVYELSLISVLFLFPLPILLYFVIGWYPRWGTSKSANESLKVSPRLISYLAVFLKINPNLERAVAFSSNQNQSGVESFRSEIWKNSLGLYKTVEEALTEFSCKCEKDKGYFKRSIDLIKSSVSEGSKKARSEILDQAIKTVYEGVQNRLESFASSLQLPTILIYGIGVLLPLVLLAVMPVLSTTGFRINSASLGLVYCVFIPSVIWAIKKEILSDRPAVFASIEMPIKDNVKGAFLTCCLISLTSLTVVFFLDFSGKLSVLVMLWILTISISYFCHYSTRKTLQVREMNKKLEEELPNALTQLGNQFKNKEPPEVVFRKTAEITRGSEISKILEKTSANLKVGGMNVRKALFDSKEGSLREVYSGQVRHAFRMMTKLLDQSVQISGEAIIQISDHMEKISKVESSIRRTLRNIVNSMKSVTLFFAPMIASITVQIHELLSEKTKNLPFFGSGLKISSPNFLTVMGLYIIILTTILTFYIVEIESGQDKVMKRAKLAETLPVSMTVFTFGLLIGKQILSILIG
ncbi:hypothetical protein AKJ51_01225 [candidate division MSBL1 archaeon SCGC-AAA382A20]|uniref:Type II secretion system protein GspF domain-containing protein n=1 Tax=candidate division MSBL1 archaeon SCGC-AAA382A20 TaxID=1698280 RepID=A0A133VLU4_9EURY|nr:hypothetical protein AKJ51_01225 [candidate division MSBL1 archaeon SCGC-AAA382A20]